MSKNEQYLSLQKVAEQTNRPLRTIQYHVMRGHLKVKQFAPHSKLTTQEWVNEWLATPGIHRARR